MVCQSYDEIFCFFLFFNHHFFDNEHVLNTYWVVSLAGSRVVKSLH